MRKMSDRTGTRAMRCRRGFTGGHHHTVVTLEAGAELLFQLSRTREATAGERTDDNAIGSVELSDDMPGDMAQPPGDTMAIHGRTD